MVLIELLRLSGLPLGPFGAFLLVAESFFRHILKFRAHENRYSKLYPQLKGIAGRILKPSRSTIWALKAAIVLAK